MMENIYKKSRNYAIDDWLNSWAPREMDEE